MNITILISSMEHPIHACIKKWVKNNKNQVDIAYRKKDLASEDILFLISSSEITSKSVRDINNQDISSRKL